MLADYPASATLPAADVQRARQFYADKLGLMPEREDAGGLFYRCGDGASFLIFPSAGSASGTHTQLGWTVDDVEAEVAQLKGRGVVFEEYDTPDLRTVNGIAATGPVKSAWFKDSEGNLLGLAQFD